MKESKAVYVRNCDLGNKERQYYATSILRETEYSTVTPKYNQETHEVGCQSDCKRDKKIICTCRYLAPIIRHEARYSGLPKQVYAYRGSTSFADIGVGSVKALQRRKVKKIYLPERIYLPETSDRGVGSSDLTSFVLQRTKQHRAGVYYVNKRTSSKCVGGLFDVNTACVINQKLSPIVRTISESTSYQESKFNRNIETGSSSVVKNIADTTTQVEKTSVTEIDDTKLELQVQEVAQPIVVVQKDPADMKHVGSRRTTERKPVDKTSSSDSLLQHLQNLQDPSDERPSHLLLENDDLLENKLEIEYRNIFAAKSKTKALKYSDEISSEMKSTSTLKRRFEALRRGLAKKEDSKKNTIIVNKVSSHVSGRGCKSVSINSDPPSLEGRSFSNTKRYSPYVTRYTREKAMYCPRAPYYRRSVTNKKERSSADWSSKAADDVGEGQGVKGMFKLWGKKFNLEEDQYKRRCTPKSSYTSPRKTIRKKTEVPKVHVKPITKLDDMIIDEKKEAKKFFFFKKKNKEKPYKTKKGVTAGRCEVRDGIVLKILGSNVYDQDDFEKESDVEPDNDEIIRKVWLKKFLSSPIDSRRSVKIRWNNKKYCPSSSTVFELIENIYKDTSDMYRSKSEDTVESTYKSFSNQHYNYVRQNIEAWMIPKTTIDRPKIIPVKQLKPQQRRTYKSDEERKDNIEVRISDQKWFIDKSKAFSHKIEVVLHSKNFRNLNKEESSEYLRIDIPKGFFVDSSSDDNNNNRPINQSSDEKVYKIVEYETASDLKKNKPTCNFNIGDLKQNKIRVTVSVEESKECISKTFETMINKPTSRDVVIQGSNVAIPKRCDVIGVGIITQRDLCQKRKPILKIRDNFSDEESEHNILRPHTKKCEFAESYLQDYYRHWTPMGIDLYSWCASESQLKCSSEHSRSSYVYPEVITKSCPNILEDFQTSTIVSSCGNPYCSQCQYKPQEPVQCKPSPNKDGWFKVGKKKVPIPMPRVQPKDSIEVYKARKIYATSLKAQWCSSLHDLVKPNLLDCNQPSNAASAGSKSIDNTMSSKTSVVTDCPKSRKPSRNSKQKSKACNKKHVSMPDCEAMDQMLAKQLGGSKPESILQFKGLKVKTPPPCGLCHKPPNAKKVSGSPSSLPPCDEKPPTSKPASIRPPSIRPPSISPPCPPSPPSEKIPSCPPTPPICEEPTPPPTNPASCRPSRKSSKQPSVSMVQSPSISPRCSTTPPSRASSPRTPTSPPPTSSRLPILVRPPPSPPSPPCDSNKSATYLPPKQPSYLPPKQPSYLPPKQPSYLPPKQPSYLPPKQPSSPLPSPAAKKPLICLSSPKTQRSCDSIPSRRLPYIPPDPDPYVESVPSYTPCPHIHVVSCPPKPGLPSPPETCWCPPRPKPPYSGTPPTCNHWPPCQPCPYAKPCPACPHNPTCPPERPCSPTPCRQALCSPPPCRPPPCSPPPCRPPPCRPSPCPPPPCRPPNYRPPPCPPPPCRPPPCPKPSCPPQPCPQPFCPTRPPCNKPSESPYCPSCKSKMKPCPPSPRKTKPTPACIATFQQSSVPSVSCTELHAGAPLYYSPIHPCPQEPQIKPNEQDRCTTPPCNTNDETWPTRDDISNRSSNASINQSHGQYETDDPMMSCKTKTSPKSNPCKPTCPNYGGSPRLPCFTHMPEMQCPPIPPPPWVPPAEPSKASGLAIPSKSKSKISGIYLKMMPAPFKKTTGSSECLGWDRKNQDDGCISINSKEKITIRLKKDTPSTDDFRESYNIKVQDEDGLTLFERKDYRLQHAGIKRRASLVGEMYKASEVRRITTNSSEQVIGTDKDKISEIEEVRSTSIANLIEIQFKLKVTQGDKITELDISNDSGKNNENSNEHERAKQKSHEVFVLKNEPAASNSDLNNNDINIRIVIKNFKPKSGKKKTANLCDYNDFSKKIPGKFHTVSTGYSDVFRDDHVYSVHRATVDLTSSFDNIKKIDKNRSAEIMSKAVNEHGDAILMGSKCRCSLIDIEDKSEDTDVKSYPSRKYSTSKEIQETQEETDTQLTDHKYEYNEDTDTEKPIKYDTEETDTDRQVDPPKYDTEETDTEKHGDKKYGISTSETDEPDTLPEIKQSLSLDVLMTQNKDDKKQLLKEVFENVHSKKFKNKTRMRKLKDMLKMILTSDSSDHEDTKLPTSELATDVTYASLKPNYFRDSDSMNNYYRVESNSVISEAPFNRQVMYPTMDNNSDCSNSVHSVEVLSSETDSVKPGSTCMCSTLAARLKLASRKEKGGGCCCGPKQIRKKNEETTCDLKSESDYLMQIDYKTTEYIDVETQNSIYLTSKMNSTNLSVHDSIRPSIVDSLDLDDKVTADPIVLNIDSKQYNMRKIYDPERCHVRKCEMSKRNRNAFLSISDKDKIVFCSDNSTRLSIENKSGKDETKEPSTMMDSSEILQSYETKKAVLEIYTEKTITEDGEHLVAKLPKFVYDREQEIQANYEAMATNRYKTVSKKNIVMMAVKR